MRALWQDGCCAARMLRGSPGYAVVMVVTLALGIGATTAIFSLVNGVLLRPLAYPQSQQLVFIGEFIPAFAGKYPVLPASARHFLEWRQRSSSFDSLALVRNHDVTWTGKGEPEHLEMLEISASLFGILRVPPALGRVFALEDEEAARPVAVISAGLWRRKFGTDPAALGEPLILDDKAYTIIGVLPEGFQFPNINPWGAAQLRTSAQPAAAGVLLAIKGLAALVRIAPADLPRLSEVSIDARVLAFALGLAGATALLFGVLPAWRMAGARAGQVLQAARRTATTGAAGLNLRNVLVTAEVGLGVALLITAGLLLGSFARVLRADLGFPAPTVLAGDITLPPEKGKQAMGFHDRLLEHLVSAPGVDSAALISALPLEGEPWVEVVSVPGDPRPQWERPLANLRIVSPGYFQTMGIPLREGRTFDPADRSGGENGRARRAAVVSERLTRALWSQQETAVGQKVLVADQEWEVIGVVSDVCAHADRAAVPMLYRVYWNIDQPGMTIVARTRGDPLSIAGAVRAAVHAVDADVPIAKLRTMRGVLEESVSQRRFQMLLTCTFAACALLLAGLGIYGVVSYSVTCRTREMGIRAALGARTPELCAIVLRQGMTPVVLGLVPGVGGALVCGRFLQSLLYEVKPHDPWIIAAVVGVVLLTAALACYLPARRAVRIDPMVALRYE